MPKSDGSEAWAEFQTSFIRKYEQWQHGATAGQPIQQPPQAYGETGFFLTSVDVPETEGFNLPPAPPAGANKRSESARAKKLVEKLLGRKEKIEVSNEIALKVEDKLETLRGDPGKVLELKQRVQDATRQRNKGGSFAQTQARHLENLKRFSVKGRDEPRAKKREEAEDHARATLARAKELQETIREAKLADQYKRHHREEIKEHRRRLKAWIVGITSHRTAVRLMKVVRDERHRRLEERENASLSSMITTGSKDPSRREQLESAIWVVTRYMIRHRRKIKRAKRTRAADYIMSFSEECRKLGNFRIIIRKFLWAVRSFQRFWRSYMSCTAARVELLHRVWDDLEEDVVSDRQERLIMEAKADDPEAAEEVFREQLQAQQPVKNSAGMTIEKPKAMSALDMVSKDGGRAKHSFRERARMKDMSQKLLDVANLRVRDDLKGDIIPEILFAVRRKFKVLCKHKGAVISKRKKVLTTENIKLLLEGKMKVDALFKNEEDEVHVDAASGMKMKNEALVYKMPPHEDRFRLFSLIGRTEVLRYIQSAQRSQGTSESLMVDPDLIPPRPGKVSRGGHKSVMSLSLGDRVFLNPTLPGMMIDMPRLLEAPEASDSKPQPQRKRKKLHLKQDNVEKLQSRFKAATINDDIATFLKKYDKDHTGKLNAEEFRHLIRKVLKVTKAECSDADVDALVDALDDDGSGSLDIEEIADFVERGSATFYNDDHDSQGTDEWQLPEQYATNTGGSRTRAGSPALDSWNSR